MSLLLANKQELSALMGLPYIQQVTYLLGIKPYIDQKTSIAGIKRRISYQSLAEALYVEPHPGIRSGSPSKEQLRRIIKALERAGLIQIQSDSKHLILKCVLAKQEYAAQNKPDTIPTPQTDITKHHPNLGSVCSTEELGSKPDTYKNQQPDIPHKDNNYLFFLREQFEVFWGSYPQKQGKQKAWDVFQDLNPDASLMETILRALKAQVASMQEKKALGLWVPNWKNPANWLAQHCWEDEVLPVTEVQHAKHKTHSTRKSPADIIWESCKGGIDFDFDEEIETSSRSNVIQFKNC